MKKTTSFTQRHNIKIEQQKLNTLRRHKMKTSMRTSTVSDYTTLALNKIHRSLLALREVNWNNLTRDINDNPLPPEKAYLVRLALHDLIEITLEFWDKEVCSIKLSHAEDRMSNPPLYVPVHMDYFYRRLPEDPKTIDECFDYLYEAFEITCIDDHTFYFWPTRLLKLVDHN